MIQSNLIRALADNPAQRSRSVDDDLAASHTEPHSQDFLLLVHEGYAGDQGRGNPAGRGRYLFVIGEDRYHGRSDAAHRNAECPARKIISLRERIRNVQDDERRNADAFGNRDAEARDRHERAGVCRVCTAGLSVQIHFCSPVSLSRCFIYYSNNRLKVATEFAAIKTRERENGRFSKSTREAFEVTRPLP